MHKGTGGGGGMHEGTRGGVQRQGRRRIGCVCGGGGA
jgi:hypothetical protein